MRAGRRCRSMTEAGSVNMSKTGYLLVMRNKIEGQTDRAVGRALRRREAARFRLDIFLSAEYAPMVWSSVEQWQDVVALWEGR